MAMRRAKEREYNQFEAGAIAVANVLCSQIREDHEKTAKIVAEYKNGALLGELSQRFLPDNSEISLAVSKQAIHLLVKETLDDEERRSLLRERVSKQGRELKRQRLGIFAQTSSERAAAGKIGGSIAGKAQYERRIGMFAEDFVRTPEQELKRKKAAAVGSGIELFTDEEKEFLLMAASDPKYFHPNGRQKGHPNVGLISRVFNTRFVNQRSIKSLQTMTERLRKKNKNENRQP